MIWDILIILAIKIDIKYVFNLSNWIIIIIWNQLSSKIIFDIMIYKNHFFWYKKEFNFFDNILIFLEKEKIESKLDFEKTKILNK